MTGTTPEAGAPQSAVRRFAERFALVAFGLYHVPLFLNNYPSLGGGGFSDGVAVRWGHLFTPPGIWVARHLFHMTGPMPQGMTGDNGDVGEEFGRLFLAIAIGIIGAAVWTLADRRAPRGRWVGGTLHVLLRYSIALGMASYAVAKILPMQFPPMSPLTLETRVGDMRPMSLLWTFMEYSRPYAFFGGLMELAVVVLLCFRRTTTLGALLCVGVMTNVALLNYAYGVQVKLYATMMVVSAAVLVLYDARRLLAMFMKNQTAESVPLASPFDAYFPAPLRLTIKTLLVGSVIVSSLVAMKPAMAGQRGPESGIDGAWQIGTFSIDGRSLDSTGNPARWRRLAIDHRFVVIRLESDAMMQCTSTPGTGQFALTLACAGKHSAALTWIRDGDVLQLSGTLDGKPLSAFARRVDYPLLKSHFRWIYDR